MGEYKHETFSLDVINNAGAAFVYFDHVPVYGIHHGIVQVELVSRTIVPAAQTTTRSELVCSGHLRCGPDAARELINALGKALAALSGPNEPTHPN
jgi:hypothetical protein